MHAKCVIICSTSGHTAKAISLYRPSVPIIALVAEETGCHQCNLYFDVSPVKVEKKNTPDQVIALGKQVAREEKLTKKGDVVVIVSGTNFSHGHTDSILLYTVE